MKRWQIVLALLAVVPALFFCGMGKLGAFNGGGTSGLNLINPVDLAVQYDTVRKEITPADLEWFEAEQDGVTFYVYGYEFEPGKINPFALVAQNTDTGYYMIAFVYTNQVIEVPILFPTLDKAKEFVEECAKALYEKAQKKGRVSA